MAVPLTLKVFRGDELVATKDYDRDIIKIGRLASAHLCLDDEKVSRIHSVIEVGPDGKLSIIDMGSVEGTYVNGKRVNKGTIAFGDQIRVGSTTIHVESASAQAAEGLRAASEAEPDEKTHVERIDPVALLAQAAANAPPAEDRGAEAEQSHAASADDSQSAAQEEEAPAQEEAPIEQPAEPPRAAKQAARAPAPTREMTAAAPEPATAAAPRVRSPRKKGGGSLGLEIRFMWGDTIVGEYFIAPGKPASLSAGTAPGVDFLMGDSKFSAPKFDVVTSDGHSFNLRFTGKMVGELRRKGETYDLKHVIESGKASHEGDSYALSLGSDDFAWVDLGNVVVEVAFQPVPKPVLVPFLETVDFTALNVFLLMFLLGAVFIVAALNREQDGDQFGDELNNANQAITKLLMKPPENQKNPFLQQLADIKKKAEAPQAHANDEGQMGKKEAPKNGGRAAPKAIDRNSKDEARMMVSKVFGKGGGLSTIFGHAGLGGELQAAMGNMTGRKVGDAFGTGGLGLRGSGGGGGGTGNTIGIGAVGTRGVAGGNGGYGSGSGIMGSKQSVDVGITSSTPEVMGSLDPELIRRVIKSHVDQIRYCYELQLPRFPRLTGKVAIKFLITGGGTVATSSVNQSTVNNAELDQCVAGRVRTWIFPKPKGGGTVIVTYPFVFKQSGE